MTRNAWLVASLAVCLIPACKQSKSNKKPPASAVVSADAAVQPKRPMRVLVTSIQISTVDPDHKREVYPRQLAKKLAAQLKASGHFAITVEDVPDTHEAMPGVLELLIGYDVIKQGLGQKSAFATVKARMRWAHAGDALPLREQLVAERPLAADDLNNLDGIVATHVEQAVETLGKGLIQREKLRVAPADAVIAALGSGDVSTELWALQLVEHRKLAQAHDAVVALLGSSDHGLRDAAIATLVALGDPRAVDPLTKAAKLGDVRLLRSIIEAVSVLGGPDAEVYLEFLASGHDDDDVKAAAAEALKRVKARGQR